MSCRSSRLMFAVICVTTLVAGAPAVGWAQPAATPAPAAAAGPDSWDALLDSSDVIVQGILSWSESAAADTTMPAVYRVDYPVMVYPRKPAAAGIGSAKSWSESVPVMFEGTPPGTIESGVEHIVFLKKTESGYTVMGLFQLDDNRLLPRLPAATFVREYSGKKLGDFHKQVLTDMFLREIRQQAAK